MAHLWFSSASDESAWTPRPLDGPCAIGRASFVPAATADGRAWVLLGPATTSVNGRALGAPELRVLHDRDEIVLDGVRLFFSTETRTAIVPLPPGDRALRCPRCTLAIAAGTSAVACPQCAVWHHQQDDLACWTYAATCALCPQPSALDADYRFDPVRL